MSRRADRFDSTDDPNLSPADLERIRDGLHRFEVAWGTGRRPDFDAALEDVPEALRPRLFRELLSLEIELRRRAGENPHPDEYRRRFPGLDAGEIDQAFSTELRPQPEQQPAESSPDQLPDRLGRYDVLSRIGHGGMGLIYRVHDAELNRDLALKVMHRRLQDDAGLRRRFIEEAQITGQLQHPGVPPVFERGSLPDGRLYYTMKLVHGETWHELLRGRTESVHDLTRHLAIFEQVAQTVAYAHSKRVLHRDLKPANVMVGRFGEVQVMDWGASKVLDAIDSTEPVEDVPASIVRTVRSQDPDHATQAGSAFGTYAYMPPEQAEGDPGKVNERADVFALGSILCEILTGSPAYTGRDRDEIRRKAMRGDLAEARERLDVCGADPALIALAKECLTSEPHDRLGDAGVVAQRVKAHLEAVQEQLEAAKLARVAAETRATEERKRRRLAVASMAAGLLLVSIAGTVAWLWQQERDARAEALRNAEIEARAGAARVALQVDEALRAAENFLELGWTQTEENALWQAYLERSLVELKRADGFLTLGPADSALRDRVRKARASWDEAQAALRFNQDVDECLAGILEGDTRRDAYHAAASRVDEIFRKQGIDLFDPSTRERTIAWVRGHPISTQLRILLAARLYWTPVREFWKQTYLFGLLLRLDPSQNANYTRWLYALIRKDGPALAALADDPDVNDLRPGSKVLMGIALQWVDMTDDAVRFLDRWQARHPDDFWLNYYLGLCLLQTEPPRPDEALRYLTAAVSIRKADPRAYDALGVALQTNEEPARAIAAFRRAIELDPDTLAPRLKLGRLLHDRKQWENALDAFREARERAAADSPEIERIDNWIRHVEGDLARDAHEPTRDERRETGHVTDE